MDIDELIAVLEASAAPNQGLRYHNGRPERRYDTMTGKPYTIHDPTELCLFGDRANSFYRVLENAKRLAEQLRALKAR